MNTRNERVVTDKLAPFLLNKFMNLFFKKLEFNDIKWHKNQLGSQKDPHGF
jgi:hypothetical protein